MVYRKAPDAISWGTALASNLAPASESWADSTAESGVAYEYRIMKQGGTTAYVYVLSGIAVPPHELNSGYCWCLTLPIFNHS